MKDLYKNWQVLFLNLFEKSTPVDIDYFNNRYPEIKDQKIISTVFMKKDERYDENDLIRKMLRKLLNV